LKRLSKVREKLKGMTPQEIAAESLLRARRRTSRAIRRASDDPYKTYVSDRELSRSLGGEPTGRVAARIRERREFRLTPGLSDLARTVETIKQFFPGSIDDARREADQIVKRQVTLFGQVYKMGEQVDWHADPRTGGRWPLAHFTRTLLRPGHGSDVRMVWELNRLHHLAALGRAYALTGDERYTEEFLIQLASWYEENPPRFGVNWTVAMEVAIRAVNIVAALEMFRASPHMTDEAIELTLKMLLAHGRFIRSNLEFSYRSASNHYLANLIGLFVIGMTVPELAESSAWVKLSTPRLLKEMDRQVLPDGVDYEGATGYHRLVLECFALFFSLGHANGIEIPGEYWERLEAMFDFVRACQKPDGNTPIIGDSDDGRLIRFKERQASDHSYLSSIAAILLESEAFKQSSRLDEEALWWFGEEGREAFESLPVNEGGTGSQAFPQAQIFIQRTDSLYAVIDCGDHGARGYGSHAHSDALSFEAFALGRTFLRDPGTFVYTASGRWRNLFRSTAYHNTVRVDGEEISHITEDQLFALGPNVQPRVNRWESTPERDTLDAEHHGYTRLARPVVHRRIITLDKREGYWVIEDIFTGEGAHEMEFFFNFDAGLEVRIEADRRAIAHDEAVALAILPVSGNKFETKISNRWVSPSYGTRMRSSGIIYRLHADVPFENVMLLVPYKLGDEERVERIIAARGQGSGPEDEATKPDRPPAPN
jgi:Heparinase II/III N-terminus/Heparinase II/III-like protein